MLYFCIWIICILAWCIYYEYDRAKKNIFGHDYYHTDELCVIVLGPISLLLYIVTYFPRKIAKYKKTYYIRFPKRTVETHNKKIAKMFQDSV